MTGTPGKLDDFISTDKINLSQVLCVCLYDNFNCQRFRAVRCFLNKPFAQWLYFTTTATRILQVFSSRAKLYGFCYLILSLPNVSKGKFHFVKF